MAQEGGVTDRETLDCDLEILHDVQPYTKDSQLKPGRPRRYRRKVAGPKQWQAVCHASVTNNDPSTLHALAAKLTDAEYAYIIGKLGEGGPERLFGVNR